MRYSIKSGVNGYFRGQGFASLSGPLIVQRLRLAERLTDSTKGKLLLTTNIFSASAEKLPLIHPFAAPLTKYLFSQHLAHHHAVSAQVFSFSIDSVQRPTIFAHVNLSPLKRLPYPIAFFVLQVFRDLDS